MEISIAGLCKDIGFDGAKTTTLDTLVDLSRRYIEQIGEKAACRAERAGRTSANILDLDSTFDELGIDWIEIREFFKETSDLKFPTAVVKPQPRKIILCQPSLPEKKEKKKDKEDVDIELDGEDDEADNDEKIVEEAPKNLHIPEFLPKFPDEHTYKKTEDYPTRGGNELKKLKVQQNSQVERSLTTLHSGQRTSSIARNYLEPATSAVEENNAKHWGSVSSR